MNPNVSASATDLVAITNPQFPAAWADRGWKVVHDIPGRMRLRNPVLRRNRRLCREVQHELNGVYGIDHCQASPLTGSVLVKYVQQRLRRDQVVLIIESMPLRMTDASNPAAELVQPSSIVTEKAGVGLPLCIAAVPIAAAAQFAVPALLPISAGLLAYTAFPIFKRAYLRAVKERRIGLDFVDSIIAGGCLATGAVLPASVLCLCLEIGHLASRGARDRATQFVFDNLAKSPRFAQVLHDDCVMESPTTRVHPGDVVLVRAGEVAAVDGIVYEGSAQFDQSALTGDTTLSEKTRGSRVFAATIAVTGSVRVRVESTGDQTLVARINSLLAGAASYESLSQKRHHEWAERAALPTMTLAGAALATVGPAGALAILYCDLRNGVRMSAPQAWAATVALCANRGLVVKSGVAFERLSHVETIVIDSAALPGSPRSAIATLVSGLRNRGVSRCILLSRMGHEPDAEFLERIGAESVRVIGGDREKADIIFDLQEYGDAVCYVGDGVNDRLAVQTATVSVSFCPLSGVAGDAAHILALGPEIETLVELRDLACGLDRNILRSWQLMLAPSLFCAAGAFTMGFGVLAAMISNSVAGLAALANGLRPLRRLADDRLARELKEDLRQLYGYPKEAAGSCVQPEAEPDIIQIDSYLATGEVLDGDSRNEPSQVTGHCP
jgi:cation transport ATPase